MIDNLNDTFGITGCVAFQAGAGGLPKAVIENDLASAEIYLHGAHVTAFQQRGTAPVLWMSDLAAFESGKAIRGGIPVVWPWFGPHPHNASLPQHGFARNSEWEVAGTDAMTDGATEVRMRLTDNEATRALWPHPFSLELRLVVGASLHVELRSQNTGIDYVEVGGALHTYFLVSNIDETIVEGFGGRDYIDRLDSDRVKRQDGVIVVSGEVDRVYLDAPGQCVIDDAGLKRRIHVAQSGSRTTVVWNPWVDKSGRMADVPDDGYRSMLCVEAANAVDDVRRVRPGDEHVLAQTISIE